MSNVIKLRNTKGKILQFANDIVGTGAVINKVKRWQHVHYDWYFYGDVQISEQILSGSHLEHADNRVSSELYSTVYQFDTTDGIGRSWTDLSFAPLYRFLLCVWGSQVLYGEPQHRCSGMGAVGWMVGYQPIRLPSYWYERRVVVETWYLHHELPVS